MREHYICARGTLGPLDVEPHNRGGENTSESISYASAHWPAASLPAPTTWHSLTRRDEVLS
jgi:hypothetical protein